MNVPAASPRPPRILSEFAAFLERPGVKYQNFDRRTFYHPEKVKSWISENAAKILSAVYPTGFLPIAAGEAARSPLVLAVLAHPSIQCAHMVDVFKQRITDDRLPHSNLSEDYAVVIKALRLHDSRIPAKFTSTGHAGVTEEFDQLRWSFCPVSISFNMHRTFHRGMSILPFCYMDVVNKKGGTANVHHVKIKTDLVTCDELHRRLLDSRLEDEEFGPCFEFAIKSYLPNMEYIYLHESRAFKGLNKLDGVVTYLGEYNLDESDQEPASHNIMLEYGERDLDEYLADTYAPVLNNEIIDFWKGVFDIAETLQQMHKLEIVGDDGPRKFRGWHGDVKPDNILRVHGKYKLADFGFAEFEEDKGNPKDLYTNLIGGTRTYGAPECDDKRMKGRGTSTPFLQTIDTWSFGCVLSAVATWVVLGSQAYGQYDIIRERAIEDLRRHQETDRSINIPTCGDAFHDGRQILSVVTDWHRHLRNSARRSDTITHHVLDLIDDKMLIVDPKKRLTSKDLCKRLQRILREAQEDYETDVSDPDNVLRHETPQILQSLLALDNEAPAEARPQAAVKKNPSMDASEGDGNLRPPGAQRVKKSERLDKILIGKTANRARVLEAASLQVVAAADICESPTPMTDGLDGLEMHNAKSLPERTPSPPVVSHPVAHTQGVRRKSSFEGKLQQNTTRKGLRINTTSGAPALAAQEMPSNELPTIPDGVTSENHSGSDVLNVHMYRELEGHNHRRGDPPELSLPELSTENQTTLPSASPATRSPDRTIVQANDSSYAVLDSGIDTRPLRNWKPAPVDPRTTSIYAEYDIQSKVWSTHKHSVKRLLGSGPPADPQLKKFISDRDIIFVVDNAGSMKQHWQHVKTVLLTLAWKIGPLDKDGLEFSFTIGSSKLAKVTGNDILKKFGKAMDQAKTEIRHVDHTDMATTLDRLFDAYTNAKKKQTLIILTDGLWQGGNLERNDVEASVIRFAQGLNDRLKKMEKRWFTIQFISFGRNVEALNRLQDLDDNKMGAVEDIIDHKTWDFDNVDQMILGSIKPDADAAPSSSQISRQPSMRRPSPSPSRSGTSRAFSNAFNSSSGNLSGAV